MEKIALITDTTSDLPREIIEKYNINVLPFRIIYKDKEYKDRVDITPREVYDNLHIEMPTSSMPVIEDIKNLYERLVKDGYTNVIAIVLSSGLSGIYNGLKIASEDYPKIITHICDSKSISAGEGIIVEECAKLIEQGESFSSIVNKIPEIIKRTHLFFVVGTLDYLKKGGRIGRLAGTIGELLNIKPIVAIDRNDGKYFLYDKVRGRKQSLNRLIHIAEEILKDKQCKLYMLHGDAEEETYKVFEKVKENKNVTFSRFGGCISPVAGAHSGPGLVGLALYEEE